MDCVFDDYEEDGMLCESHGLAEVTLCSYVAAELRLLLREAITFVEQAGMADNSGHEYCPECQECGGLNGMHKGGCKLLIWLVNALCIQGRKG